MMQLCTDGDYSISLFKLGRYNNVDCTATYTTYTLNFIPSKQSDGM